MPILGTRVSAKDGGIEAIHHDVGHREFVTTTTAGSAVPLARPLLTFWVGRAARQSFPSIGVEGVEVATQAEAWAAISGSAARSEAELVATFAPAARVAPADLSQPDPRVATLVPESLARRHGVVPMRADGRTIWLATADPLDFDAEQAIGFVTSRTVMLELAGPAALADFHDAIYDPGRVVSRMIDHLAASPHDGVVEDAPPPQEPDRDPALEAPIAKLIDALLGDAVRDGASDIHVEPVAGGVAVRYRIDGVLKEVMKLPDSTGPALVRRIKVVARLDVTNSMRPQDGRMAVRVDNQSVDLRVSTLPVARRGEKIVIRILDKRHLKADLNSLGLAKHEEQLLARILGHREGLVLVTGPTGSGKTTTLYAALNQLRTGKINITTVEDPVEYDIPDIAQIQVNEAQGLTFASALRSVLRQDPDVVLVGEIRDRETAEIAVQASMTGHLVLSTLHTNDAPSAAVRMRDMGVDSFKLGSTLIGIIAQRLVRKLCEECAAPADASTLPDDCKPPAGRVAAPRVAVGCKACRETGYRGRMPIMEVLLVDQTVGRLIEAGESPKAIASVARRGGMRTLWESGLDRVWDGRTSLDEVQRALGERHDEPIEGVIAAPEPVPVPVPTIQPATPPAPPAADATGGLRVLVVDDDPQMRRFVRMVLEREKYEVIEAADGLEALEVLDAMRPDLVLLDLDMPRLDGMATLEEIRDRPETATLPVILLTARTEDEGDALDKGASDFLAKPLQPKTLAARVRAVLRRSQL